MRLPSKGKKIEQTREQNVLALRAVYLWVCVFVCYFGAPVQIEWIREETMHLLSVSRNLAAPPGFFLFFADLSLHRSSKPSEESSSCLHDARRFCCSMLCSSAFTEGWPVFGVYCILTILHRGTLSCECAQSLLKTSYKYGIYFSEHTTIIDRPLVFFLNISVLQHVNTSTHCQYNDNKLNWIEVLIMFFH